MVIVMSCLMWNNMAMIGYDLIGIGVVLMEVGIGAFIGVVIQYWTAFLHIFYDQRTARISIHINPV